MEAGRNGVCGRLTSINVARFESVVNLVNHSLRRRRRSRRRRRCWCWLWIVLLAAREHHATDKQGGKQKCYFFHC